MIKDAYYFSHDCNARNDERVLALRMKMGAEGYGIYFMLLERLRESTNYMSVKDYNVIAFDLRVSAEKIKSVINDFGLFEFSEDGKLFYSNSLLTRMAKSDELRNKLSEAGKKGNDIKYSKSIDRPPIATRSPPDRMKGKERKGKERKVYTATIEEMRDFCTEHGYVPGLGDRAFYYYSENGWKDKRGTPVTNWKNKLRNVWFKDEFKIKPVRETDETNKW